MMIHTTKMAGLLALLVLAAFYLGGQVWRTLLADDTIARPNDAPLPRIAEESRQRIRVPSGFRIELVADEPLIDEPSGVCWNERGQLFVCELHGYNLEGQYDIEELNKTGQLDREVRRIQANERAKEAALAGTFGVIKLLSDSNGDGRMDSAQVWADGLPPSYGACPARGGLIVACAPDIVYLADRTGDGKAETREVLFTGFGAAELERRLNAPQWGPDNWIYFGGGHGGGTITGPHLPQPVQLPNTDFRIKPDGTAIEPVSGKTHTFGFTFTESAERVVITTRAPLFVAPLPWRYLARNPDATAPRLEYSAILDPRTYPISRPHPWRTRRAEDPGFGKYYTDRYGVEESAPNGYFTSACSPLVYQDQALPGLYGQLFCCEPSQNMIHRAILERDGPSLTARRTPGEEQSEFLASDDLWFQPISLAHGPDGAIWIVDFYREIIEDYSAIPRYLQQLYGLMEGRDRGRVYRLVHDAMPAAPQAAMDQLTVAQLVQEIGSSYLWRRQTARRLLVERRQRDASPALMHTLRDSPEPPVVINVLATLDGLESLHSDTLHAALTHENFAVQVQALRWADQRFADEHSLLDAALTLLDDSHPAVALQLALSLGESDDPRVVPALTRLARQQGNVRWMKDAILSALSGRGGKMLAELLRASGDVEPQSAVTSLGEAISLLAPLSAAIGARRNPGELSEALVTIASVPHPELQVDCLRGLLGAFPESIDVELSPAAREGIRSLRSSSHAEVRSSAEGLAVALRVESADERQRRLRVAAEQAASLQIPVEARLGAIAQLAAESDPQVIPMLLTGFETGTPPVRDAILAALFARRDRLPWVLDAVEQQRIPASALSGQQRLTILEHGDETVRQRSAELLSASSSATEETLARYVEVLRNPRDVERGERVFRETCAKCHQAHGVGHAVGPDLTAEFQRAEETIVHDMIAPSATMASGYVTYVVETTDGRVLTGLIAGESANSILLRQPEGKEQSVLRKDIELLKASPLSMMPEDLIQIVSPQDLADCIAWLRRPVTP
jgi:putative membrane-bound dehydrogenase-like protein